MVYLTATLSPADEVEFFNIIKVQILDDCKFCKRTSRPNIAYSVVKYNNNVRQTKAVYQLVAKKLKQYLALTKIIVYSSSIKTIKELSSKEVLNCYMYYTNVGSVKEKD
jgi:superfamily II DNA helicase RecQ